MRGIAARTLACALTLLTAAALCTTAASATTTGIDIDTALVDQVGQMRIVGAGGAFDVTCDVTMSKFYETRLVTVTAPLTWIGYLTSAAISNCPRPVSSVTAVHVPATLGGGGGLLNIAYTGTDLATGSMLFEILGWAMDMVIGGVPCRFGGSIGGSVRANGRDLTLGAALPLLSGGSCPLRVNIDATMVDLPALQYTLLSGRR